MLGRLISKIREAQLPDTPKPLKLGRIDQRHKKTSLRRLGINTYYVVNGIAVNAWRWTSGLVLFASKFQNGLAGLVRILRVRL